jgi:ABC-type polysaccharide/polyol phosphate transport system ATPase subunit
MGVSKLFSAPKQRTVKAHPSPVGGQSAIESFWALNDINLTINKGETVGIIGP